MDAMRRDWFDAVSNGNIEQIQQLIRDKIPVDIVNEVIYTVYSYITRVLYYQRLTFCQVIASPFATMPSALLPLVCGTQLVTR